MRRRLIVTVDDFGLAIPVNEAVERGHREGIVTAASLMVAEDAAADAVARANANPTLAVGLHVVVVAGRPLLPPERIPDLVGRDGLFNAAEAPSGQHGRHAMLLVGYTGNFYIVKNSWGTDWGQQGYCLIPKNVLMASDPEFVAILLRKP